MSPYVNVRTRPPDRTVRNLFIRTTLIAIGIVSALYQSALGALDVAELTARDLSNGYLAGEFTAAEVTQAYLDRIRRFEPNYNAFTWLNPDALSTAAALDQEFAATGLRGPLHGIPVVVKESMDVVGAPSTFGYAPYSSVAGGIDLYPVVDSTVVARLKAAGAIILGKTNMPPFSAFGDGADSSWDGRTYNALDRSLAPGSSSTGTATAVAASFAAFGLGEETQGSIQAPAGAQDLVGVKPTFGLVPNTGLFPLSATTRDVVGPIARTVADAALALDALAGPSAEDPKTMVAEGRLPPGGYTSLLSTSALEGKRIGLYGTGWYSENQSLSGEAGGLYRAAQDVLRSQGAILVDDPFRGTALAQRVSAAVASIGNEGVDTIVYDAEKYLERLGLNSGPSSLDQLKNVAGVSPFEPGTLLGDFIRGEPIPAAVASLSNPDVLPDISRYLGHRQRLLDEFNRVMTDQRLDALVFPASFAALASVGNFAGSLVSTPTVNVMGTPAVTVPASHYRNGSPFELVFLGGAFSEPQLLAYAYDFEQATLARTVPQLVEDRKVYPSQVVSVLDLGLTGVRDGLGDRVEKINLSAAPTALVEQNNASGSSNRERRLVARFDLPDVPSAAARLEKATLQVTVVSVSGVVPPPLALFHSPTNSGFLELTSLFEDASFTDTQLELVINSTTRQLFELDVTDLIRQDYALDGPDAMATFRLQMRELLSGSASTVYSYRLNMPRQTLSPELTLKFFVPEPETETLLVVPAIGLSIGWMRTRRRSRRPRSELAPSNNLAISGEPIANRVARCSRPVRREM